MAQTGYTPILIYSSSTTTNAPSAGNLTNSTLGSELAINITDGKLFYKDNANAIQVIGWKTTPTSAGGTGLTSYTAGDLLYYATGTALSKLAIGASTTVLTSSGSAPQWTAQSALSVGTASNLKSNATTGVMQIVGPAAASTRVMTIPDANFTAARTDAGQTFTGNQIFSNNVQADTFNFGSSYGQLTWDTGVAIIQAYSGKSVVLRANGSSANILTAGAADVTVGVGNLVQGTAAKGINFTANTPAAGMTSQLLNWYEEGTWTPVLSRSGGAPTISYTTQVGSYVRIGKLVFIKFNITWTGLSGSSGYYKVTGLPFTMTSGSAFEVIPVIDIAGITFTAGYTQIACEARQSDTALYIIQAGSNVTSATFTSGFAAAGTLIASGCYRID